jgi:hypothetical protein
MKVRADSNTSQRIHGINPRSDECWECFRSIEESCVIYPRRNLTDLRWHWKCFKCYACSQDLIITRAMWSVSKQRIVCISCSKKDNIRKAFQDLETGFERVTLLTQYVFLVRVAFERLQGIWGTEDIPSRGQSSD